MTQEEGMKTIHEFMDKARKENGDGCVVLTKEAYSELCMRGMDKEYFEWVPTSERLPELKEDVLASLKNGRLFVCCLYKYESTCEYWWIGEEEIHFRFDEVAAWMPLPEPYREESEEAWNL